MIFTQYLMPDGRQKEITIDVSPETEALATSVVERGGRFEAEMLTVSVGPNVSFTCHYQEEDIAIRLAVNGPKVITAVEEVVREAHLVIIEDPADVLAVNETLEEECKSEDSLLTELLTRYNKLLDQELEGPLEEGEASELTKLRSELHEAHLSMPATKEILKRVDEQHRKLEADMGAALTKLESL